MLTWQILSEVSVVQLLSRYFCRVRTALPSSRKQSESSQGLRLHAFPGTGELRPQRTRDEKSGPKISVDHPSAADILNAHDRVNAMLFRLGVDSARLNKMAWLRPRIDLDCASCGQRATCRLWLADPEADPDAYKQFCPNAKRLAALN